MSTMRISGMASGMDIDTMVTNLMKAERMKVDALTQKRQIIEWQQEDYRSINSTLRSFRDNQVFKMKLQSTYMPQQATTSNSGLVTVSASSSATAGSHTVVVSQLARGASITSGTDVSSSGDLSTLNKQFGTSHGVLDFTVNDVVFKIDAATESVNTLISKINGQKVAGVSLNTTQKASETTAQIQELKLADSALTEGLKITVGDKVIAMWNSASSAYADENAAKKALGADYLYDIANASFDTADEIITDIAGKTAPTGATWAKTATGTLTITSSANGADKAVSAKAEGGKSWEVKASYDDTVKRFFLYTNKTGSDQHLKVEDNTLSQLLKLTDNTGNIDTSDIANFPDGDDGPKTFKGALVSDGRNADVTIDSLRITNYKTNNFTLNGVTYNLQNADSSASTTVTVAHDTESVFKTITSFVDEYNKLIETIENKLNEQRYKDYNWPLSDTQKESLTDSQIDQWKEKARSGMLRNDETLRSLRDKMRMAVTALSKLGISTTADYTTSKLVITESGEKKLREAIANDPQGVMDIFRGDQGVAQKLSDSVGSTISTIIDKAGSSGNRTDDDSYLGKRIDGFNDDIDAWEDRLTQIEDRYYKQFTAMEKALSQMNQQSSWLAQQFSS